MKDFFIQISLLGLSYQLKWVDHIDVMVVVKYTALLFRSQEEFVG